MRIFRAETTAPATNRTVIERFLQIATGGEVSVDFFIEIMRYQYGCFNVVIMPEDIDVPVTPDNFGAFFTRHFGLGYSMIGAYESADTALTYLSNDASETRTGDRDKTGERTENTTNGGKITTKNTGTTATATQGDLTVSNTGTTAAANSGNVTTQNSGTDERSLGAWNAEDYQGAEKTTNTGSDTTTDTRTTTTTNNLTETTRDGRTITRTDNLTNEQTDTRTQDKTADTTDTESYTETVTKHGGNPSAANYYFDSKRALNAAELFCAEFVKRFCISVI